MKTGPDASRWVLGNLEKAHTAEHLHSGLINHVLSTLQTQQPPSRDTIAAIISAAFQAYATDEATTSGNLALSEFATYLHVANPPTN